VLDHAKETVKLRRPAPEIQAQSAVASGKLHD